MANECGRMTDADWEHAAHYASLRNALRDHWPIMARDHLDEMIEALYDKEYEGDPL